MLFPASLHFTVSFVPDFFFTVKYSEQVLSIYKYIWGDWWGKVNEKSKAVAYSEMDCFEARLFLLLLSLKANTFQITD